MRLELLVGFTGYWCIGCVAGLGIVTGLGYYFGSWIVKVRGVFVVKSVCIMQHGLDDHVLDS